MTEPSDPAMMDHAFIVLGTLEFVFKGTTKDGNVEIQALSGSSDEQEFELSNFTGKIVVRKQTKQESSFRSKKSDSGDSKRSGFFGRKGDKRAASQSSLEESSTRKGGVSFDLSTATSSLKGETFVDEEKPIDRVSESSMDDRSYLSALEEDEEESKLQDSRQTYMSCRELDIASPVQEQHVSSLVLTEEDGDDFQAGLSSPLHGICASLVASLDDLRNCLVENPEAPFTFNEHGQTPLHILAENSAIWQHNSLEAFQFGMELININPAAVTLTDRNGVWPFVFMLQQWTQEQYQKVEDGQRNRLTDFVRNVGTAMNSTGPRLTNSLFSPNGTNDSVQEPPTREPARKAKFPKARVTAMLSSALKLLSFSFTSPTTVEHLPADQQLMLRERTCRRIAADIPRLLPTLLLLEPELQRSQILGLPLVRRLLLERTSVGPWLVAMMRRKGVPSQRAVDYLELVSDTTFIDFLPESAIDNDYNDEDQEPQALQEYRAHKIEVFDAVGDMSELVLSLFAVEKSEMDRAVGTKVLWHVIQYLLQRRFIIGIVMIDFVLHLTLMLSFRADVLDTSGEQDSFESKSAGPAVSAITIFFFSRKVSEGMALFSLSKTVFRHYMLDFWNLFDMLAIVLLLVANSLNASGDNLYPAFNAFVLTLLWLKILGFLKAVNKQMATFILACMQIMIDIRYFMVVLLVFIMMFGDIMIITFNQTRDADSGVNLCQVPEGSDAQTDFCSGNSIDSYVRMYGVLIGDFELQDFKANTTVLIIFLFFTMIGVIILLNILIAVVSDSYEKATVGAKALFGTARVGFLAEHIALEQFLQPGSNPLTGITQTSSADPRGCFVLCSRIIRYIVLLGILVAASLAEIFLVEQAIDSITGGKANILVAIVTTTMCLILTIALWVVLSYLFTSFTAGRQIKIPVISCVFGAVNKVMNGLMDGLRKLTFGDEAVGDDDEDEWTGRVDYLEQVITNAVSEAEQTILVRIQSAEEAIKEHEDQDRFASNLKQDPHTKEE